MVKVQKPQPKSLSKTNKLEGVTKEKKQKLSKGKKTTKTSADVAEIKKIAEFKKKPEIKKPVAEQTKPSAAKQQKSKPAKKPLILAPPPSPPAAAPKVGKKAALGAKKLKDKVPEIKAEKQQLTLEKKTAKKEKKEKLEKPEKPVKAAPKLPKKTPKPEKLEKPSKAAPKLAKKTPKPEKLEKPAKAATKIAKKTPKQPQLVKESKKDGAVKTKAVKEQVKTTAAKKQVNGAAKAIVKNVAIAAIGKGKGKGKGKVIEKAKGKGKQATLKKKPQNVELTYELKSFDEDKFNGIVSKTNVQKICDALKTQVAEEVKKQKATSIFSDYRFILQVCSYKIPSCPKRVVKLALKHSLIGVDDDVAVIVTDLQRGAKFDYEPTVQHYEDLLREAGIKQRLTVVPFNRLRNDMVTFEAKRKFVNSYDYLLCDGRISGQANAFLGNCTQKSRNVLHAVRLSKEDQLPKEFARALSKTAYRQLRKGDLIAIPVGNHEHSGQQLADNILHVVQQLQVQYPGGLANIRSIYLKIDIGGTSSLPLYISMCAPPADTPYVVGPREQRMLKLKKQANEVLTKFALTKDVDFIRLTGDQVKRKAELREQRIALKAADGKESVKDNEDGEEETPVPAKKARKAIETPAEDSDDDDDDDDEEEEDEEDDEEDEEDDE